MSSTEFKPISKAAWALWGASATVSVLFLSVPLITLASITQSSTALVALPVVFLIIAWLWWITYRRWKAWGYAEFERDLHVKRGVLVRRLTVVPYGRMQFVDVRQGPLERIFGLSSVKLHTAAAATDAVIPFLPSNEAERLRTRLTELGEAHAAGI